MSTHYYPKGSHEQKVYDFYRHGVEAFGDFHGGYLNFGLWEHENCSYLNAAENLVHRMGTLLGLSEGSELLDVACGMGAQDVYLAQNFSLSKITAIDLLPEHLKQAEKRVQVAKLERMINLICGSATALPFAAESFTHVLCIEGLVHFNTRSVFFAECFRVLKPDGRVAFCDFVLRNTPRSEFEKKLLYLVTWLWQIPYENAVSPIQYKRQLETIGFKDIHIQAVGDKVIPGYLTEQARPECIKELTRIRGFLAGRIGHIIDIVLHWAYRKGLVEYILVDAQKPSLRG